MEINVASLAYVYTFEPRDRRGGILGSGVRGGGGGGGGGGQPIRGDKVLLHRYIINVTFNCHVKCRQPCIMLVSYAMLICSYTAKPISSSNS